MKTQLLATVVLFSGLVPSGEPVRAQSNCAAFEGEWSGAMTGQFRGPTSMRISGCAVAWLMPDGRTNYCTLSPSGGGAQYACNFGSRGTVRLTGKVMTFRNTHTGDNYTVSVTRR